MVPAFVLVLAAAGGSIHAEHARVQPQRVGAAHDRVCDPPSAVGSFSAWVYGYYAFWLGTVDELPWDRLTHVAIFSVDVGSDGALSSTEHWTDVAAQALALAEPYGVHVHLAVTSFDAGVLDAMLSSPAARSNAVAQLGDLVDAYGGHGVSVDFEGMDAGNLGDLPLFVQELKARVAEVSVATPAVDWAKAYDYPELAASADALFIMGYDYHWRAGDPGPVAPLFGGAPWGQYALDWSVADYLATGVPASKLVLGLPLYGYVWPTVDGSVPGTATGDADSILFSDAKANAARFGAQWDELTHTPYYFPNGNTQAWYDDVASLDDRITWALDDQGMGGIGVWALNYDGNDPELWDMIAAHTQTDDPDPTGTTSGGETTSGDDTTTEPPSDESTTIAAPGSSSGASEADGSESDGTTGPAATSEAAGGCGCRGPTGDAQPLALLLLAFVARRRAC
jgi:GH18 family chitinase